MEEWGIKPKSDTFKDILKFKAERVITGYSIMQVIIMYCEELDLDIEEIGEELKKDKKFREILKEDLKFNNEAVFDGENEDTMKEWILS